MQLLKSIFLCGLLAAPSLGELTKVVRGDHASRVVEKIEARADPPSSKTTVDIAESKRELSGGTLYTEGLLTCVAVIIRNMGPGANGQFDKVMGHVSSNLCQSGDSPPLDDQLDNIWALYDSQPFPNPEALVIYPRADNPAQNAFNGFVMDNTNQNAGTRNPPPSVRGIERDQSNVMAPGGSRLWIDQSNAVYWSTFDGAIA
ncbi:hypothetical protein F4808DRAFT_456882 [Astrocystis sublimbata]|nr:hypothetical protein F4808DRAFT_456882 [Astrocystis sublimbata]